MNDLMHDRSINQAGHVLSSRLVDGTLMPMERQICAIDRAIANEYWLHTPKFGSFDHFQRWRFAT
jgi:hypothetical protein